jgi:hypothetical protein
MGMDWATLGWRIRRRKAAWPFQMNPLPSGGEGSFFELRIACMLFTTAPLAFIATLV